MTIAQEIANRYHNDGQLFTVNDIDIDDVARASSAYTYRKSDFTLFVFDDESMLVIGNFWDIMTFDGDGMLIDSNGESWGSLDDWQ